MKRRRRLAILIVQKGLFFAPDRLESGSPSVELAPVGEPVRNTAAGK